MADVSILATRGFVSIWYKFSFPAVLNWEYIMFESIAVDMFIAVSVKIPG